MFSMFRDVNKDSRLPGASCLKPILSLVPQIGQVIGQVLKKANLLITKQYKSIVA